MIMKRLMPIGLVVFALLTVFGCRQQSRNDLAATVSFDTLSIDTVAPLFAGAEEPACHFRLSMEYPTSAASEELLHVVDEFIVSLYFKEDYVGLSCEAAATKYCKDYLSAYEEEGKGVLEAYGKNIGEAIPWMSYEEISTGRVLYCDHGFLSYAVSFYSYRGGAHGNSSVSNKVLNLATYCPLYLNDLFNGTGFLEVSAILRNTLAKNYGCASVAELAETEPFFSPEEIDLTENFFIDDKGITWQYNPYEIAPYSMGLITVTLSWAQVLPFLLEDSPLAPLARELQ